MQLIKYPSNQNKLYFFNFTHIRIIQTKSFFYGPGNKKYFCKTLAEALDKGLDSTSNIFIYGIHKKYTELETFAKEKSIAIYKVEDAFIRSVALGSAYAKPYSLVIDSRGIYFDPSSPSDLEYILQTYDFSSTLLHRAKLLRKDITTSRFSKYNHLEHSEIEIDREKYKKVILVVGQVEDDMSIKLGAFGLNNQDLLEIVRKKNPEAYIIYKPHPDVLAGNRLGHISQEVTDSCANEVQTNISIDSCIIVSDEIHTLTSGAGFDALLRGKKVFTYGMPFYAGWGLTTDYKTCSRRTRKICLDALVAATLILYPRYISPKTEQFCEAEQTLGELKEEQEYYFSNIFYRYKINLIGYFLSRVRKGILQLSTYFNINTQ